VIKKVMQDTLKKKESGLIKKDCGCKKKRQLKEMPKFVGGRLV
jgi:hypothetical protein